MHKCKQCKESFSSWEHTCKKCGHTRWGRLLFELALVLAILVFTFSYVNIQTWLKISILVVGGFLYVPYYAKEFRLALKTTSRKGADGKVEVDSKKESTTNDDLWKALDVENLNLVASLIKNGGILLNEERDNKSLLMFVVEKGNYQLTKLFLDKGADINHANSKGFTALMVAAFFGYTSIVKLLLEYGANCKLKAENGATALKAATREGHTDIVLILETQMQI